MQFTNMKIDKRMAISFGATTSMMRQFGFLTKFLQMDTVKNNQRMGQEIIPRRFGRPAMKPDDAEVIAYTYTGCNRLRLRYPPEMKIIDRISSKQMTGVYDGSVPRIST